MPKGEPTNRIPRYDVVYSIMADVDATELFEDESINWKFCTSDPGHITFLHKEACEFIIDCGTEEYFKGKVAQMKEYGCTEEFIEAYEEAYASGAKRVLFYA